MKTFINFKSIASVTVLACLVLAGRAQTKHSITVTSNEFIPASLTIEAGDTVEWINVMGFHNVNGNQATYPSNAESFGNSTGTGWTYSYVFGQAGEYNYQCDPHVGLGMVGEIVVESVPVVTVNFSGMNPHVDQDLWFAVFEMESGKEIERTHKIVEASFSIATSVLETGKGYYVDFFADHNGNGYYDAPPVDHAWRLEIDNLVDAQTLNFVHNTDFNDIAWAHKATVNFTGMDPHDGQNLYFTIVDKDTDYELTRQMKMIDPAFSVEAFGIEPGNSYYINFFADHNGNGEYDAPPTDHAWQLDLDNVMGDTMLTFSHNTDFTDIDWKHMIRVNFSGMDPHNGQHLWLTVIDKDSYQEIDREKVIIEPEFSIEVGGIELGHNYHIDFFADFNENGYYDAPPTDHTWRLELTDAEDFNEFDFVHNVDFTDIQWKHKVEVNFTGMDPHDGQNLYFTIVDKDTDLELARQMKMIDPAFSVGAFGIKPGNSYYINFFADHNGNGEYDVPPTDHAWQLDLDNVMGDTMLTFSHNTDFTDIDWKHKVRVNFSDMDPHNGQYLWFTVIDKDSYQEIDREKIIIEPEFSIDVEGIELGHDYHIDFFADFNENGYYDAPPTDHTWRLELTDAEDFNEFDFVHNVDFTDIQWKHKVEVNFTEMDPHDGQNLYFTIVDKDTDYELTRQMKMIDPAFSVEAFGIKPGNSYYINFFADHNGNGEYDAPPTDHAWQLDLDNVMGDTMVTFSHNTDFTDIDWKHKVRVNFSEMDPHNGQRLWLAVIDKDSNQEIDRIKVIVEPEFSIDVEGIELGHSYHIDFFADLNNNGYYDAPPTDHTWRLELDDAKDFNEIDFVHNVDFTDIKWKHKKVEINFAEMDPHVGQDLWLAIIDKATGNEINRDVREITSEFSLELDGTEPGGSYLINFYADLNKNGYYDAPPVDHAWQLNLDNVIGDTTIEFLHNTDFTNIAWSHKATVTFTEMDPHDGQNLWFTIIDRATDLELTRQMKIVSPTFSVEAFDIKPGKSYYINFFADHNSNGKYDVPPTDHAWQLDLDNVMGDTMMTFSHNTNFTDIDWKHKVRVNFSGMDPHNGQHLWLAVIDKDSYQEIGRVKAIVEPEFSIEVAGIEPGNDYHIDFFADLNENGYYDAPPTDHTWRLELDDAKDFNEIDFVHNVDFTDIKWKHKVEINFAGMDPHVGQDLWLAIIDKATEEEIYREVEEVKSEFSLELKGTEPGGSYLINFYADLNKNGYYDAPPTDHAWQLTLDNVIGDTTLEFIHNTDFTDIAWSHKATVMFKEMNPHVGQLFKLYLFDLNKEMYVDSVVLDPITEASYNIEIFDIMPGSSYHIDFYADLSGNREYDAPPADHAWRIVLENAMGDTSIEFTHNTTFTDIFDSGSTMITSNAINELLQLYPNPASNNLSIILNERSQKEIQIKIFTINGQEVFTQSTMNNLIINLNISELHNGLYFIHVQYDNVKILSKFTVNH